MAEIPEETKSKIRQILIGFFQEGLEKLQAEKQKALDKQAEEQTKISEIKKSLYQIYNS